MRRGTTPTLTFVLPFSTEGVTKCNITFVQNNVIVLEKTISNVEMEENVIRCKLKETETLLFDSAKNYIDIQIRIGIGADRYASQIIRTTADKILKDGVLE